MAIVMQMRWEGVTPELYDAVRREVGWEEQLPDGGICHIAWFEDGALRVVDAWQSAEAFETFTQTRLMPGVAKVGIVGEPDVSIQPAHRVFDAVGGNAY